MKRLFRALILPALMMATLAGCGGNSGEQTDYNDLCAKAADAQPMLLNASTGKEIYTSSHKKELSGYNSVLALKGFTYKEKEFKVDWELTPADKWTSSTYLVDNTRLKMTPNYDATGFEASLKATVSYAEGGQQKGKAELSWAFDVAASTVKELTLKQINENYVKNGNDLGDMAKDSEGKDVTVGTRGIVTSTFEKKDHVYAGVFIQDGEYALQLYAGSLSSLWAENGVKEGDCVFVVGKLSVYGVIEMGPTLMEIIDPAAYNIAEPVTINLNEKEFTGSALMKHQSTIATFNNLTYVSGNVEKTSSHATIKFSNGDTEVAVYCNYHIGPDAMTAIQELVDGYDTDTVVNIKGILSFYNNDPQIIPIFGAESFIAPQAA